MELNSSEEMVTGVKGTVNELEFRISTKREMEDEGA